MIIIGVDFHPDFQQIASVDTDTGEFQEKRLTHCEEAEKFYRAVAASGQKVRVGMEAALEVARGSLLCTRKRSWRMTFGSWAAGPQIHGCFGAGGRKVAGGPDYIHLALKIVFSRRSSTVFSLRRGTTAPEWEKP
jgi:hypothetical protein